MSGCYIPGGGWTLRTGVDVRTLAKPAAFVEMVDTRWDEWNRVAIKNATARHARGGSEVITVSTPVLTPANPPPERLTPEPNPYDREMPDSLRSDDDKSGSNIPNGVPPRTNGGQEPTQAPGAPDTAPPAPERPRDAGPSARLTSRSQVGYNNGPSLSLAPPLAPSDVEQDSVPKMPDMVTPPEAALESAAEEPEPVKEKSGLNLSGFQLFNGKRGDKIEQSSSTVPAPAGKAKSKKRAQGGWLFGRP